MQQKSASRQVVLRDPRVARWVRQPLGLSVLRAFMAGATPLAPVAEQLTLPPSTVLRWARRWLEVGALVIDSECARAGRPVKWYRAVSTRFFIPYEAEGLALPEDVVRRLVQMRVEPQVRGLIEAARVTYTKGSMKDWGTVLYADRHGELVVRPDFAPGRTPDLLSDAGPAYLNFYSDDLRMSAAQAKRLQRELVALLKRYKDQAQAGQAFTLSLVLTPRV
jgi:hypothetical protein